MLRAVFVTARSRLRTPYGLIVSLWPWTVIMAGSLVKSFFTVPNLPLTKTMLPSLDTVTLAGASTSAIISCSVDVANQNPSETLTLCILVRHNPLASRYKKYAHAIGGEELPFPTKGFVLFELTNR